METPKFKTLSIILILLTLMSCGKNRTPQGVMNEDKMAEFLIDAYHLEGFYSIESGYRKEDLSKEAIISYDNLLKKHGITAEDFEKSLEYYTQHEEKYKLIHQRVIDSLDAELEKY